MHNYPTSRKSSDPGKLYLGRVCLRGHEYLSTGLGLRYKHNGQCAECRGVSTPGSGHYRHRDIDTLKARFWRDIDKRSPSECWEWKGGRDTSGYGHFKHGNEIHRIHRLSYQLHHGEIPEGMHILHSCDNKICGNPAHLRVGTNAENMREKAERGLCNPVIGEANFQARLNADKVRQIRSLYQSGYTYDKLGVMFGVSKQTCASIVKRKTWKHVD